MIAGRHRKMISIHEKRFFTPLAVNFDYEPPPFGSVSLEPVVRLF
jgi:hypothetical protein